MKSMLVGIGLFIVGFGVIAVFGGGLSTVLFGSSDPVGSPVKTVEVRLNTLGDYGDAVEIAYERMLSACSTEDRKAYGRAMNALTVAKRHADSGKIERGDIGSRVPALLAQFVDAVRKGVIANDHVPFGSLRTVIASVQKDAAASNAQSEPTAFVLRGSIGAANAAPHNDCQVL